MAKANTAVSFDSIIAADRRKKNEALANEIFGKKKDKKSARSNPRTSDLASRITKTARSNRIASALNSGQANVIPTQPRTIGQGFSIKGKAGPFVVEARNFAPGTTAADIESALADEILDSTGSSALLSCRLVSTTPTVIAEMTFTEKYIADRVISMYDQQKADGRILRLSLKSSTSSIHAPQVKQTDLIDSTGPAPLDPAPDPVHDNAMDGVELANEPSAAAYDDRNDHDSRHGEPDVQDSRYGFDDSQAEQQDERRNEPRRDRDRDRDRDYERERERDRDRDRNRERDHDRYERRQDRGSYRQNDRPSSYNTRTSHYGNGVGAGAAPGSLPQRGFYNGGQGGFRGGGPGRMYSDEMMRGGWRGGGFGGGYRGRGGY
ncbi:uncharacterized protein A1O9_01713 [Exophiala aquamarina CBS 119918]|uniref:RRM domain-containing protein n=1 Tax=Exophiala aquamarina CBS 119918 TaxID=1182545 RepID=A0A072Q728_9EURO|nr:uncharacterized protein A1O9_01713 [Exophiala aquamarina CBS 119918]KEF63735.1 hypothetical protein A1O9_01713 [Exophiala aquamarina CBS 119918]